MTIKEDKLIKRIIAWIKRNQQIPNFPYSDGMGFIYTDELIKYLESIK